jgi:hypothetical protein
MKKAALLVVTLAFVFTLIMIGPVTAETQKTDKPCCPMKETMGGKDMTGKGCRMGDMPMHCMMGKQIVATSDGGIVITIGNKLYKYDGSLNLQKEVEIPFDKECMMKMMKDMDMMQEKMDKPGEAKVKGTDETKPKE